MKRLVTTLFISSLAASLTACVSPTLPSVPSRIQESPKTAIDPDQALGPDEDVTSTSGIAVHERGNRSGHFDWPVDEARMTRGFFLKPKKKRGRPHLGIDLAAPKGTPIYAAHEGLVIYVGREFRGYGRMVMVEGKDGFATLYAHLSKSSIKAGTTVAKGDLIGEMGRTGRATGVHLHFEIRMKDGPVDPLNFLPGGHELARQASRIRFPVWVGPDIAALNPFPSPSSSPSWISPRAPAEASADSL
ncbi:MAG: M23 family metallopeptidase [Bdellovibrionaceae bacterium]|nr:M23 family metallopeptidase [Pseudobdellovibrionaceae bacterium]